MTSNEEMDFFVRDAIHHARELSHRDSLTFLRGLILMAGDNDAVAPIRKIVMSMQECDAQLLLIESGQLKLFNTEAAK